MSSAGTTSGASTRSSVSGSAPAQTTPLPQTPTPTPTPTPAQPTPTPISNTPTPTPTPTPPTTHQSQGPPTTARSPAPSSTGYGNVPLDPGDHHGGRDQDNGSQTTQIVVPIVSTIAAVIFLVGMYRLALYIRHRRQQKTSAPLPPPRIPNMLANRQSVMVDNMIARQSVMMDYDMVPPLLSASTSGHNSLQGSSRTVSTVGGRSPLLINDQPITAGATPFPTSSASSVSFPSEDYDYTKPIPRRPRPISVSNPAHRQSVFSIASNRNSVHGTPRRTSLRGAPHHSRIDIVLPEPLGPTSGLNQTALYPPRMPRASQAPMFNEMGLQPMRHAPPSSRASSRLRSYTPEDIDNESVTSPPSSSQHHTQDYTLPPVPPLPPTLTLSPFLTPDTPLFTLPPTAPSSPPNPAAAVLPPVVTTTTTTTTIATPSASNETPNVPSLPSPAESSSPTTLTTAER